MSNPPKVRKVAVLGSRAVGKSSLTVQFVENHFAETYYPTIENTFTKTIRHPTTHQEYALEIYDTAGQDEYSIMNSKHALGIHGYVLVYSIASRSSFEMCAVVRDKILNYTGMEWVPMVLVANKLDLHLQRQVTAEEGEQCAKDWRCAFMECSAKMNQGVGRVFETMLLEIEKSTGNDSEPPKKGCILQ
ncbi:small GTPase superfamily [Gaertneriomyces semiglobifer]|nr:small GTPase superfamily [Gaertneriomyces semiglobifer]